MHSEQSESYYAVNFMKGTYINVLPVDVTDMIFKFLFQMRFSFLIGYDHNSQFEKRLLRTFPNYDRKNEYSLFYENNKQAANRISMNLQSMINMCGDVQNYFNIGYPVITNLSANSSPNSFRCMKYLHSHKHNIGYKLEKFFSKGNISKISFGIKNALDMSYLNRVEVNIREFRPRIKISPKLRKGIKKMKQIMEQIEHLTLSEELINSFYTDIYNSSEFIICIRSHNPAVYSYKKFVQLIKLSGQHIPEELSTKNLGNAKKLINIFYSF